MRLRNLAWLALCSAVSMLTACGSSAPRQIEPMPWRPAVLLPAELAARCQPVVRPIDDSDAAAAVALEAMYGLYGTCAGKHVDTVDYINKPGKDR